MTIPPDPADRPARRPGSGLDPLPGPPPTPPVSDVPPDVGDPAPHRGPDRTPPGPDGRLALVASGREDRRRHVVDVTTGELGDPGALRARCGAPVSGVVPGLSASQADCPVCLLPS